MEVKSCHLDVYLQTDLIIVEKGTLLYAHPDYVPSMNMDDGDAADSKFIGDDNESDMDNNAAFDPDEDVADVEAVAHPVDDDLDVILRVILYVFSVLGTSLSANFQNNRKLYLRGVQYGI